ncbi:O-antigen polymerase [Actinobacillus equuli]|uniref:O-antigen polymerase n=1 Tax=Actinobacillus equuli TaxID=718 RepID=UPI0024419028|nr:O-antigen ligase [Actinobacillus equuli]WGE48593.1 oligosaccharide repeat unit polymerase [Actinobacillus equuli subsp. equuli]
MNSLVYRIDIRTLIFSTFYFIFLLSDFLLLAQDGAIAKDIIKWIKLFSLFPLMLLIFNLPLNLLILGFVTIVISTFYSIYTGDSFLLYICLLVFFSYKVNFNFLFKIGLYLTSILVVLILIYFLFEYFLIGDSHFVYDATYWFKRYTFNFDNPNAFSMRIFIFFMFYVLFVGKLRLFDTLLFIILFWIVFYFSNSRTAFYIFILCVSFIHFNQIFNILNNTFVKFLINSSIIFITIFSILSAIYYQDYYSYLEPINQILSKRIYFANEAYNSLGIEFYPRNIKWWIEESDWHIIDNGYVYLFISGGILVGSLFIFTITWLMYNLNKFNLSNEAILLMFSILYILSESHFINIYYNIPLLLLAVFINKINVIRYLEWKMKNEKKPCK